MTASLFDGDRPEVVARPARAGSTTKTSAPASTTSAHTFDDFFNCEVVTFEVEDVLFSVNKRELQAAGPTTFETIFTFNGPKEGSGTQSAIHLEGVQKSHFRAFLRVLHRNPPDVHRFCVESDVNNALYCSGLPTLSEYNDWTGVLRLATMWEFKEIRFQAITAIASLLKKMPTYEMISAGRTYQVIDWVRNGYMKICQIKQLRLEELRDPSTFALDWETIAKIYQVREMIAVGGWASFCVTCKVFTGRRFNLSGCPCHITPLINEVFQEDFQGMSMNEPKENWDD